MPVVTPSSAVTLTVMGFSPTASGIGALALPDVTSTPFTLTVADASDVVGVTVVAVVRKPTVAV